MKRIFRRWTAADYVVAAVMVAAVIAAGLVDKSSESSQATDRNYDDGLLKPHCSVAPKGVDGIPCTWHTLAPLQRW
jgi:hypothetical protein